MNDAGTSVTAVIPARRGSKRLRGKNLHLLGGKPMLAWTLEAALEAGTLSRCVLSTDDPAAAELGGRYPGIEVRERKASLATDEARNVDVLRDLLASETEKPDLLVLLQPTSPLRLACDIDAAVERCRQSGAASCVSVVRMEKSSYWLFREIGGRLTPLLPRDEGTDIRLPGPAVLRPNGSIFVVRPAVLEAGHDFYFGDPAFYEMPRERSIDIDDAIDVRVAEALLGARQLGARAEEAQ